MSLIRPDSILDIVNNVRVYRGMSTLTGVTDPTLSTAGEYKREDIIILNNCKLAHSDLQLMPGYQSNLSVAIVSPVNYGGEIQYRIPVNPDVLEVITTNYNPKWAEGKFEFIDTYIQYNDDYYESTIDITSYIDDYSLLDGTRTVYLLVKREQTLGTETSPIYNKTVAAMGYYYYLKNTGAASQGAIQMAEMQYMKQLSRLMREEKNKRPFDYESLAAAKRSRIIYGGRH